MPARGYFLRSPTWSKKRGQTFRVPQETMARVLWRPLAWLICSVCWMLMESPADGGAEWLARGLHLSHFATMVAFALLVSIAPGMFHGANDERKTQVCGLVVCAFYWGRCRHRVDDVSVLSLGRQLDSSPRRGTKSPSGEIGSAMKCCSTMYWTRASSVGRFSSIP